MTIDLRPLPETALIPTQGAARRPGRIAGLVAGGLVVAGVVLTPFAKEALPAVPSYMLAFGFAMIITNLLLAGLMFSRGVNERSRGSIELGAAYWFVAVFFFRS